jgi:hypothetical protein
MNSTHCHSSPAEIPLTVEPVDEQLVNVPSSLGPLLYASTPVAGMTQEPAVALGKVTVPQAGVAIETTPDADDEVTQVEITINGVTATIAAALRVRAVGNRRFGAVLFEPIGSPLTCSS